LINSKEQSEYGQLFEHQGLVNCLEFLGDRYLLSGASDGEICVWNVSDWSCAKTMRGHGKAVTDLSIHPSGKVALSVGDDKTVRLWDLMSGQLAATIRRKKPAALIQWSPSGKAYAVVSDPPGPTFIEHTQVAIFSAAGDMTHAFTHGTKVLSLVFITEKRFITGCEDGSFQIWDMDVSDEKTPLCVVRWHDNRVNQLTLVDDITMATASTDGTIAVWDIEAFTHGDGLATAQLSDYAPMAAAQGSQRITAMVSSRQYVAKQHRKKKHKKNKSKTTSKSKGKSKGKGKNKNKNDNTSSTAKHVSIADNGDASDDNDDTKSSTIPAPRPKRKKPTTRTTPSATPIKSILKKTKKTVAPSTDDNTGSTTATNTPSSGRKRRKRRKKAPSAQ
jgi:WD40 repeat protein